MVAHLPVQFPYAMDIMQYVQGTGFFSAHLFVPKLLISVMLRDRKTTLLSHFKVKQLCSRLYLFSFAGFPFSDPPLGGWRTALIINTNHTITTIISIIVTIHAIIVIIIIVAIIIIIIYAMNMIMATIITVIIISISSIGIIAPHLDMFMYIICMHIPMHTARFTMIYYNMIYYTIISNNLIL